MTKPSHSECITLSIDTQYSTDCNFQVLAFSGHEAINQPFCFTLELVSERLSLDLESLLGLPA
ncbi:hypothetical protein SAMN05444064_1061, partial [Pseudomonas syringae]|uniref:hypothetical protein n=1 Tax=Pseudomonas syringae TaxID=317 RepID=UPI000899AEB4